MQDRFQNRKTRRAVYECTGSLHNPALAMGETTEIRNVIIGTAGHIDHGKSTLVETLTGINPSRLDEERARGMTIDFGFANFLYQDRYRIGMIDVPGHEKFVKNMVAGASGMDIVLLVVAADDGVMPQTREHLEILTLLGVTHGVIALNKVDIVDDETVEFAREDIHETVEGTFLESAPVVAVSALKKTGIDDLWQALSKVIEETAPKDTSGVFRMPVQRVFSAKGHGAVLTGIPVAGTVGADDNLVVLPGDQKAKVRGIQAYHSSITEARAGHSTALNLGGVDHTKVHRGFTVAAPGVFEASRFFSLQLQLLKGAPRPLKHRAQVKFHVGTSELIGTLHLLDRFLLEPGQGCCCQILLQDPVVAGIGDHFILRLPSPAITLGGGRVIRRESEKLRRNSDEVIASLEGWAGAAEAPVLRVEYAVLESGPGRIGRDRLVMATELAAESIPPLIDELLSAETIREFGSRKLLIHLDAWPRARARMVVILKRFHAAHPAQMGLKNASVQQQLGVDARTFQPILAEALEAGELEQRADLLGLPGEGGKLSADEKRVVESIATLMDEALLNPPTLKELGRAAGADSAATQNAIDYLCGSGRAQVLHGGVLFSAKALEFAKEAVRKFMADGREAAAKDFKEVLPTSRKFLIPLLEWMDQQGVTRFVNGIRTLKAD